MKTILSSDYFLSRIVRILGEIGFVPGCLILLVLMTMSSFASAHHLPNSIKDHKSFDLTTSFELTIRAYDSRISEPTPGLDEEHPHGGRISFYPITGTIYDAGGGIPGVVIKIKGTNIFTITDEFGQFQIDAQKGDILIISYPDYETIEVPITEQTEINLELFPAVTQLEEAVINAGYYTVKDKERTGSIYKVTAKEIENQPVNNVLDALQGRVPGLDITPTTGLAGGGYTVRIRGQNSISAGNDPLYIIDGVPQNMENLSSILISSTIIPGSNISSLNTLDPSIIESVEILKDADATAIYGSRGANGVILITTKKGALGKTKMSIDVSNSIISITKFMDLLNTDQYIKMRKQAFENDGITDYPINAYDINGTWDQNKYTDWQKELIGNNAQNQNAKINISGGNDLTSFSIGSSMMKETTVFPSNHNYKRFTAYSSLQHHSKNKRFNFNLVANYGLDKNNLPANEITRKAITLAPNAPNLYNEDGEINWENSTWENPIADFESNYRYKSENLNVNSQLSYLLLKNLKVITSLGYTSLNLKESKANPSTRYNPAWGMTSSSSNYLDGQSNNESWIIEPQLESDIDWSQSKISLTIGGTFQELIQNFNTKLGIGYPTDYLINNFSAAQNVIFLDFRNLNYKYIAGYARINYSLKNKLFLNATGRRDGSSRFGPGNKFSNFGALGTAWIISNESFFPNNRWLSFVKLRSSYGITGNDQIGDYQYLNTYSVNDSYYDGNIGLLNTRLFNPHFAWEKNKKAEIALELNFLEENIKLETTYYNSRSENLLTNSQLPATTGFTSIYKNIDAIVENSGWEFLLQSKNINSEKFSWFTSINFSLPKTKLLKYKDLENSPNSNYLEIGYPLNIVKLYEYTGINPITGLYEFNDINNDGIISPADDKNFIANLNPSFYGSISNSLQYKRFNFDFTINFVKKYALNNFYSFPMPGTMFNQPTEISGNGQNENGTFEIQPYSSGNNEELRLAHSRFISSSAIISDASFMRLKNMSLSYKLPIEDNFNCIIYLQGQNLITITNYKGFDPEQTIGFLPPTKRITIGAKINF